MTDKLHPRLTIRRRDPDVEGEWVCEDADKIGMHYPRETYPCDQNGNPLALPKETPPVKGWVREGDEARSEVERLRGRQRVDEASQGFAWLELDPPSERPVEPYEDHEEWQSVVDWEQKRADKAMAEVERLREEVARLRYEESDWRQRCGIYERNIGKQIAKAKAEVLREVLDILNDALAVDSDDWEGAHYHISSQLHYKLKQLEAGDDSQK